VRLFETISELRHYLDVGLDVGSGQAVGKAAGKAVGKAVGKAGGKAVVKTVGFVPTMGALHDGHLSLMARARQECDIVVVSIFVNPLQFAPGEDFEAYPRPAAEDEALCQAAQVDVLFAPSPQALYGVPRPDLARFTQVLPPPQMTNLLCGRSRPTHFQGVATVVTKLLNVVRPTYAYFGQKDAQQVAILKRLVQDLNLPGQIVVCPIVRSPDGLALSSRNRYLSEVERQQATILYKSLRAAQGRFAEGEKSSDRLLQAAQSVLAGEPAVTLDYLALVHPDTLEPLQVVDTLGMMAIAAHVGKARLIDNVILDNSAPAPSPETLSVPTDAPANAMTDAPAEIMVQTPLSRRPIIAIDGPAGAGKSTVARQIAHQLGLLYLDTGAMYRALTWFVLQQGIAPDDSAAIAQLLPHCHIQLTARIENNQPQPPKVSVNGQDVTQAIRSAEVTAQVSTIAAQAAVRANLVQQQQQYGTQGGVVADGRDIGTQVFPDAELKIYLTASVEERAQRRYQDLKLTEQPLPDLADLAEAIAIRDQKDSTRQVSPLRKADDAIEIVTDHYSAEQVIEQIIQRYRQVEGPVEGPVEAQLAHTQAGSSANGSADGLADGLTGSLKEPLEDSLVAKQPVETL
jgi:pantoate ligase / CMP/dCMP kinase